MSEQINENTDSTDIVDIELLAGKLGRIVMKDSIAMQVSDVQKMKGPTARINGITRDPATDKMVVSTKLVEVVSRTISTEFTQETLQDMKALYGEDFYEVLAYYLSDELAYLLDSDFFDMINEKATIKSPMTFDGATYDSNIYDVVTQVFAKINKERMSLSSAAKRPLKNFAIVTANVASLLMNNSILAQDVDKGESGVSLLGSFAGMDIYLDNTHIYSDLITSVAQSDSVTIAYSGGTLTESVVFTALSADIAVSNASVFSIGEVITITGTNAGVYKIANIVTNTLTLDRAITTTVTESTTITATMEDNKAFTVNINGTDYTHTTGYVSNTAMDITTVEAGLKTALSSATSISFAGDATNDGVLTIISSASGTPYTISTSTTALVATIVTAIVTPNVTAHEEVVDYVTIGIKGNGYSKGSTIVAPFNKTFLTSQEESSGELRYHLLDRTALLMNPADNEGTNVSKFLVKFDIDLNDLALYSN